MEPLNRRDMLRTVAALGAAAAGSRALEAQTVSDTTRFFPGFKSFRVTTSGAEINGVIGENDEIAIGALEAIKAHGLDPKTIPVAGVDGVTDALLAVKRGEMMSTLQDADAQAQGAIDLAIVAKQADYAPKAAVWDVNGGKLAWEGGKQQHYSVPWIPVTLENVDGLLEMRKTQ